MKSNLRVFPVLLLLLATTFPLTSQAQPPIEPITSKVKNVEGQFFTINDHGTPSGFTRGTIDPNQSDHYQGIARHPTLPPIFFISKSGDSSSPPAIMGAYLSSEATSRHMNHNLWRKDATNTHGTSPNGFAFTYWEETENSICSHFGGIQASGKILAVAAEDCHGGEHGKQARIFFYNVDNTSWPSSISVNADGLTGQNSLNVGFSKAGAVGIIEDSGNLYTIAVFTDKNRKVRFRQFELDRNVLTSNSSWFTFNPPPFGLQGWETGSGAHQNLNLVRQDDDKLYAIGLQRGVAESDRMFLYRVDGLNYNSGGQLFGSPQLFYRGNRHMYCTNWESGSRMCDFQAAAGVFVVDGESGYRSGELTVIATAHDDDKGPNSNLAPITEFRNRVVRTIDSGFGDCGTSSWATLYDDDHMDGDRNITITEHNNEMDDFKHLHKSTIDFGDKASAIAYCIEPGCTLTAYKHSGYSSPTLTIVGSGSGTFGYDNNLDSSSGGFVGTNWSGKGDEISSVRLTCN